MAIKLIILAVVALVQLPNVNAHYTFVRVAVNNKWHAPTRYFRNMTTPYDEDFTPNQNYNTRLYNQPYYASDRPESVRCGRDNLAHAADTEILTIKAGDTIKVAHTRYEPEYWKDDQWYDCPEGRGSCVREPWNAPDYPMDINHAGPFIAHLSKAPEGQDVRTYDGSGTWTKIFTLGLEYRKEDPAHWLAYNNQKVPGRFVFKIPKQTPAGQYLLRSDVINTGINYTRPGYEAQLYPSCVQLRVQSAYRGRLPEGIQIPDNFTHTSPGMAVSLGMYNMKLVDEAYVYPGGKLWDGETFKQDKPNVPLEAYALAPSV